MPSNLPRFRTSVVFCAAAHVGLMMYCVIGNCAGASAADFKVTVEFPASVRAEPFSGRVYLFFSKSAGAEPRRGPNWFRPEPFVSLDVRDWQPGAPLEITPQTPELLSYSDLKADWDEAGLRVQAVARFNPLARDVGSGPGNAYSDPARASISPRLELKHIVSPPAFAETASCKLLQIRSAALSKFHGRDVPIRGAVLLPLSAAMHPDRRYPVVYEIPGFSGDHQSWSGRKAGSSTSSDWEPIRVLLDPTCAWGHHVFADSANNGPWGEALVREFIPALEQAFPAIAAPTARFVTGHSSGGWSSLWLQVRYPETFGGVWSTSPDPVDFHNFQYIDLYQSGENMYRDRQGARRPIARRGGQVAVWYDDFDRMELVLGYGGQLQSFEAVFSPRGSDGLPRPAWNRTTGEVDTAVTEAWKAYDIVHVLEQNWERLGPQLAGKLHVYMGDADTFYLEGATRRLKASLEKLGSDAKVELFPGKDHSSILSPAMFTRLRNEMQAAYLKHHSAP